MKQSRKVQFTKAVATVALSVLMLVGGHRAEAADFQNPMIQGYRLDVCRVWGSECGKPAADAFCQRQGFGNATLFTVDNDIGAQSPTRVIATGQICNEGYCDGFKSITCASSVSKSFPNPSIGGYRVDWCREWATACGQPAATAFCRAKGYTQASAFTPANDIGVATPTRVMGTGQICNEAFCDGFSSITCR